MSWIHPIGAFTPGVVALHAALPHVTLAGAIAVWRRRACAIALGRCSTPAYLLSLSCEHASKRSTPLTSYAEYLKTLALQDAAAIAESRLDGADTTMSAKRTRLWPCDYPMIDPIVDDAATARSTPLQTLGAYVDVIL
ncbi:MAG: hypothetical protein KDA33_13030 [Phycisphaerales bacterium]|nr:hypothetical protein [Phycisphaerales bacterium]